MRLSEKEVYKVIRHLVQGPTAMRLAEIIGTVQLRRTHVQNVSQLAR
jgi:hypothetical protein